MWTCRFLSGVPFDTLRRGDGVREHAPRRVDGVRDAAMAREQTRVESVAATAWGPDAVDAAERPRERAGLLEAGRAAAAPRAPRERDVADGGADSEPKAHRYAIATKWRERPRRPRGRSRHGESKRRTRGRETTTLRHQKQNNNTGPRHPRPPEAAEAHVDVLRVLPRDVGRAAVHGRRRAGLRYSRGQLDRPVRPAG